ncbi:MAG TPA: FAD-dependent oxidoreductase [Candidatus Saccharimonadales bacterium]|nr:FAD-dependent oxidoreductase [Candidatus Saccharimonadales bacterium]
MKIAIIGAGFTGLSAAYKLLKEGHEVTIFEKDTKPGGLAIGYKEKQWEWTIEQHYHHWFTNDSHILNLAKEINYPVVIKRPKTSVYLDGKIYQLDSPFALLTFPKLPLIDRLRMVAVLGFLRLDPFWKPLEKINANKFLTATMGKKGYGMLWETQLRNKMGKFADDVSLVWFWSRIKKRTPSLAYPKAGFLPFAEALAKEIEKLGGKIYYDTEVTSLLDKDIVTLSVKSTKNQTKTQIFDKAIVTLPSFLFLKMSPQLPEDYKNKLIRLKGLGATNMVLRLNKPFLPNQTYWLSICEKNAPIMVIVEHTNFMDKKYYNGEYLVYVGNYPAPDSEKFTMSKEQLLQYYDPFLKNIQSDYHKHLLGYELFKAPFAQPIVPTNYSKFIPPFKTPLPHVFLANIEQVYPWDRGTNYAVELGEKIAGLVTK